MRIFSICVVALACGNGVSSNDAAKEAYLGLDTSIDKAIALGFAGFNSAQSANISPQTVSGDAAGTMTITGQVDQGASANKTMRLAEALTQYSDDGKISYVTQTAPTLDMALKGIPTGTLTGSLQGDYTMSGNLSGTVTLDITFSSTLEAAAPPNQVERKAGTTRITGTATSGGGTYAIDITR